MSPDLYTVQNLAYRSNMQCGMEPQNIFQGQIVYFTAIFRLIVLIFDF